MPLQLPVLSFILMLFGVVGLHAATYYVAPGLNKDNDTNNINTGTINAPFALPQTALNKAVPGDTVLLRGGNYIYSDGSVPMVFSTVHRGSDTAWLTVKNYPGETPVIQVTKAGAVWNAIELHNAAYVEISGLTLLGWNDDPTMLLADAATNGESTNSPVPTYNGNGISCDGRDQTDSNGIIVLTRTSANRPHHIRIIGNTVSKFPGGGISFIQSDYIQIENNTVEDNSWYTRFATSGISIWQAWNYPDAATADTTNYRINVIGNRCFGNKTLVDWTAYGRPSDGNGIIIDDSQNTQNGSTRGVYNGRILVASNLVVNNGGSGIHSYRGDNVDIVHNTAYYNGQVMLDYGEIFASESVNVRIYNNICYARPDRPINNQSNSNTNVDYRSNIYFGGYANAAFYTANNTTADPLFLNADIDLSTADFGVSSTSPAIDVALTNYNGPLTWVATLNSDITGGPRTRNFVPDIGAYERSGRPIPATGLVVTGLSEAILAGDTTAAAVNDTSFPSTEVNLPTGNAPVHTFTLLNRDSSSITLSSLSLAGSSAFTLVNAPVLPLVLAPSASVTLKVRFLPTAAGIQSGTISLVHSSPNTTSPFTFALSGTATQIPAAGFSASSLSATLPVTTSSTHNGFILTNRGSASLTWNAALPKVYTVADSLSPTGPSYAWVDISSTGQAINFGTNIFDNAFSSALSLGFAFPYFGTGYTQLCIDINGHVSFDLSKAGNTNRRYRVPSTLASMLATNNGLIPKSIAVFFDDLLLISGTSSVRYQQTDSNTFVVSWINVTFNADSGKAANLQRKLNFQVILKRDGTITAQYQGVTNTDGNYLIGIVNSLPTTGVNDSKQYVQYAYTANAVNSGLAVRFTPPPRAFDGTTNFAPGGSTNSWANFTGSTSGTLAPGASQTIPLAFNSTGLVSGLNYATSLTLTTNDTANSTLYIPVSLSVGGTSNLSPSVSLTQPSRNLTVQGAGSHITLTASASDPDGSITQVEFYSGTTLLATDTTSPYTYTWNSSTAGTHTITAKITDNRSVTVTSQGYIVTVVNLPPVISIAAPAADAVLPSGVPLTVTAAAADGDAGTLTKVEFYLNDVLTGTDFTAPFTLPWTPSTYGPVTIKAKAFDNSGASTTSATVNVTVVSPENPSVGLIAYWRLDETTGLNAPDQSGNARPLTLANSTNLTWSSSGRFRNALAVDGNTAAKASFDHPIFNAFSISAWVLGDVSSIASPRIIALPGNNGTGSNGYEVFFRRNTTNSVVDAQFTGGLGFSDGTGRFWWTIGLQTGVWYHIVVTFDGSSTSAPVYYINNTLYTTFGTGTAIGVPGVIASTSTIKGLIGNRVDTTRPYAGRIDQVRLYNRVLTASEVNTLYLDDGGPGAPANLSAAPATAGLLITWNPVTSTNGIVTYQLARSLSASGPFASGPFATLATNLGATSFTDTTTAPGTTYFYTLTATASGDTGPVSTTTSATTWTALQAWRNANLGSATATGNAADLADPDGDGIPNLLEYALGLSPSTTNPTGLPTSTLDPTGKLTLTFLRARSDVTYTVQGSSDLATWTDLATNPGTVSQTVAVAVTDKPPVGATKRFLRLRVTSP
ncbi:MAG: hypothetical protein H2172_08375 [Opitutus sp.]|nr:hypothetical protein [Opitutus sp.]MCS6246578.1 hypothetical protein [Opitutus sp.]MCS6276369.1 hypothetical protein [Opitutus sp.]MCS6301983.1 hypothetical protein [Opitutus sp.]